MSIEAWVTPAATDQTGPARIVSLSRDTGARNFTLGQSGGSYAVRLRTTGTSMNGTPELVTPPGTVVMELTHVVYVRDGASGETRLYVNGIESVVGMTAGDFSGWDAGFRLSLANEVTSDRPWLGTIHAARIYSRALSVGDVLDAFVTGYGP